VRIESDAAVHIDPRRPVCAVTLPVEVSGRVDAEGVRICVSDAGPGLPAGEAARLFEPFFRGTVARSTPGTGMGLAIARGLLAAEQGRIWAENREGGGARFWIAVPAESRPVAEA
jgi:two-component system, OmpR family, sensor histidine kinase KdpD